MGRFLEWLGRRLEPPRRERLDHVEDPEEDEANQRGRDIHRDERQRDQHADDFVQHDRSRIDTAEIALRGRAGPHAGGEEDHDQPHFDNRRLAPPHEEIEQQAGGRAHRAWRNREIPAVADGGDEDGEPGHAGTTRVSATLS